MNKDHRASRLPRRSRLPFAVALATALTLAAALLLTARPGAAFEPLTPLAAQAAFQSDEALRTRCANLMGAGSAATSPASSPMGLLTDLRDRDRIVEAADRDPAGEDGGFAAAGINGIGLGGLSQLRLLVGFYRGLYTPTDFQPIPTQPLTGDQVRVLVRLHELGHSTGALDRDTNDLGLTLNGNIVRGCIRLPAPPTDERAVLGWSTGLGFATRCAGERRAGHRESVVEWVRSWV